MITHLWQSTLFVGVVWLATIALRHNSARVRYWLWMAASLKFLVPVSWLVALGAQTQWRTGPAAAQPVAAFVIDQVLAPSIAGSSSVVPSIAESVASASVGLPAVALAVWLAGVVAVCVWWWRQWLPVRAALRAATLLPRQATDARHGLPLLSSPMVTEPAVVGLWRQILLVPEGLFEQLPPAQTDALLAHERCHARHRDNLMAAVHMAVEALFWFHPAVWWIEHRLLDERERACDEDVLRGGSQPADYAEGILAVCRHSVGAPLACVAGISGSDLRRRIESILLNRSSRPMSAARRCSLALAVVASIGIPIGAGAVNAVPLVTVAQESPTRVAFDVASVKVNTSGDRGGLTSDSRPGVFTGTNVWVAQLINYAYSTQDNQLEAPEWVRLLAPERFDVTATLAQPPAGLSQSEAMRLAMRTLLAERFNLVVRRETREVPMYALVMARRDGTPGPMLKPSTLDCSPAGREAREARIKAGLSAGTCGMRVNAGRIQFGGNPMSVFARQFSPDGRSVIDRTGLTGNWEFELTFAPEQPAPPPPGGPSVPATDSTAPSLTAALQEQLGLKLENTKGTVEMLIVERIDRPTEN